MTDRTKIEQILKQVELLPVEDRAVVAYRILREMRSRAGAALPRVKLDDVVGILRGSGPAPTDQEVKQIVEAERLAKYGQ